MAAIEGEEEQNKALRACHKRCAERTLKAMEKNGGIFIKLGQHLVRKRIFFYSFFFFSLKQERTF